MENKKVLIIAEAGVNHNGEIEKAFKLIDAAVEAGADIIKFQTFKAHEMILPKTKSPEYQIKNVKVNKSQFELLNSLELTDEMHVKIINYCNKKNIEFLSSAFSIEGLDYLIKLGIKRIKIPSGEITNLPYLEKASLIGIPIIISTGMSTLSEVIDAYKILTASGLKKEYLTFLHCTSEYPAKLDSINLKGMTLMAEKLSVDIGYSDHSLYNETSISAVALGASIIEKHITIDKNLEGPDHIASLEPKEFKQLVNSIRNVEVILGQREKIPNDVEIKNMMLVRKSIVAAKIIKKGDFFSKTNLTTKRPGYGLSPMLWNNIIGKRATKNYKANEFIDEKK